MVAQAKAHGQTIKDKVLAATGTDPAAPEAPHQLTCERCGNKTDAGVWLGFVYVGAECLTKEDRQYIE
jgi:hypothetical protein